MRGLVVRQLILKDVRLHRLQITLSVAGGLAALALIETKREVPAVLGATWFFVALIVLGCMLPLSNVINEKKKQNLAFVMSLPGSPRQFALAKTISTFGMFFVPWALLFVGALLLMGREFPHGIIPVTVVLNGLVFAGFCLVACIAIATESEGWATAAIVVCNSSYGIAWFLIVRVPATAKEMGGAVAVWSPRLLAMVAAECACVVLSIGLMLFFQSRKRDFI